MLITERLRSRALKNVQASLAAEIQTRRIEAGREPVVVLLPSMPPLPKSDMLPK